MKAVILAGGYGTRISEETDLKPKPMIEIGGMPLMWHILKLYSFYNINEFIKFFSKNNYELKHKSLMQRKDWAVQHTFDVETRLYNLVFENKV